MVEGRFRGTTRGRLRAEIPKICEELRQHEADVFVFLTDADVAEWTRVKLQEARRVPEKYRARTVYGVADRNIESWLAAEPSYLAGRLKVSMSELSVPDPKGVIERQLRTLFTSKEAEIALIVKAAPMIQWLKNSKSFAKFYEEVRDLSQQLGCDIPNELGGSRGVE